MLFNSLTFAVFFAIVLGAFWTLRSWSARKNLLLIASYVFYGAWNPPFVALLAVSTLIDWAVSFRIASETRRPIRVLWLLLSLSTNLGMLGFFKYGGFLLENLRLALAAAGIDYQPPDLGIVLPVGISFYTFQTLSYTIDVYRRQIEPTRSLRDFALFVAFFPQLVAGPIVRAVDFLPQCVEPARLRRGAMAWGLFLVTLGLFQKVVLADTLLAGPADTVFGHAGPLATLDAWGGVLAFSSQILFDFGGYSTCAIGAALCLGFSLPDNFRYPYAAVGFSDFWRRWHISLSSWLRDYLYIPLGGNRRGRVLTLVNLMLVMLIGGLWHGAAWTFVAWGAIHGTYLLIEHLLRQRFPDARWVHRPHWAFLLGIGTFIAVCVTWVFFRASDFTSAARMLQALVGAHADGQLVLTTRELLQVAIVTVAVLIVHWCMRRTSIDVVVARLPAWTLATGWAAMIGAIILSPGNGNAFIYFQF